MSKSTLLIILVLYLLCPVANAKFSIFDGLYKKVTETTNEIKEQNNTKSTAIMSELGVIKDNTINLEANLTATLEATIQASIEASVEASVTGLNKSINETITAGRDVTTTSTSTNETPLMSKIFSLLFKFVTAISLGLLAIIRAQSKHIRALEKSKDKKQTAQDEWERKYIDLLTKKAFKD